MAGSTRLELATSGVTGRRSNQLNYDPETNDLRAELERCCRDSLQALRSPACTSRAAKAGGRYRTRTCDSRRVKPVLYQLS